MRGHAGRRAGAILAITATVLGLLPTTAAAAIRNPLPPLVRNTIAGQWIVTLRPSKDPDALRDKLIQKVGGHVTGTFRHALNGFAFSGSDRAALALQNNPNVRSVVRDHTIHAVADDLPTGIRRIRADHPTQPSAYAAGFRGAGVRVAILDTGIDLTHPDLVPNLDVALGLNCIGPGPPQDGHGHGTHVAGIVAAAANGAGVIGVAPEGRLVPFKVLDDSGSGAWSNLICAIDQLTGYMTDADPTNDVRVANMSLGDVGSIGTCSDGGVREAICRSVAAGVTYVAAAGNSTVDTSGFIPAAFPEVVAVSAITDLDGEPGGLGGCLFVVFYCDDTLAEFSNFGAAVDLAAPGMNINSDWVGGGYMTESGTSMAAPHVAGVAALVIAANPLLGPEEVARLLRATGECPNGQQASQTGSCVGKGQRGNDPDGIAEPLVNALRSAQAAAGWDRLPTVAVTAPADGASVSGVVAVTATATDDHGVASAELLVNGVSVMTDNNGADGWSFAWNTAGLDPGWYSLTVKAIDTSGQFRTDSVTVKVGQPGIQGDWAGTYGVDGYVLGAWNGSTDLVSLPAGVTAVVEQASRHTWAAPTTDVRAQESPTQAERRATTWYDATQVRIRLNFANAYNSTLHLYALDWDATIRRENVTVDDGSGPRVIGLSSSFNGGAWLHFPILVAPGGSVVITADNLAGSATNAVIGGLYLGGAGAPLPPPPPPSVDQPGIQGDWAGTYGVDGYVLGAWNGSTDLVSLPAGVTAVVEQASRHTWAAPTTDVRAQESPTQAERRATTWYDATQVRIRLNFANAYNSTLHLYALDWDATIRRENVTVDDGSGPRVIGLSSSFNGGAWLHFPILVAPGGSVVITADNLAGSATNAVIGGLYLGGSPPATVPGAPMLVSATPGNGQVALTWTAPASNGGSSILDYTATASPGAATCTAGGLGCTIAGLTNGTAYTFTVAARNAVGTGPASNSLPATPAAPATVPGAPTLVSATPGNAQVALTWTAPASNGGSAIIDYSATASPGGGTCTASGLGCTVTGLSNGQSYTFTVTARNGIGTGTASNGMAATPVTVPGAPTLVSAAPGNAQVVLSWTAPASNGGSAILDYTATASPGGATCTASGLGCTVTGLTNGQNYAFTVKARNAVGFGAASNSLPATPAAPATVPGAPTLVSATPGNAQVALTWTAPASNGGSAIIDYTATASPGGAMCSSAGLSCTVTGLTNGTNYSFTVTARNVVGSGPGSNSLAAKPATVPGAPRSLAATARKGNGVTLTWLAPLSNGGSAITGYRIYRGTSSGTETLRATVGNVLTYRDATTTTGVRYYYFVVAVNAIGQSVASGEISIVAK